MHSRILASTSASQARDLFTPYLSGYWVDHFSFGTPASSRAGTTLGRSSAELMVINAVVPILHAYATTHGDEDLSERAIAILQELPAERNYIIDAFARAGLAPQSAFDSQAIIQLRRRYCQERRCLACRIGHHTLSQP